MAQTVGMVGRLVAFARRVLPDKDGRYTRGSFFWQRRVPVQVNDTTVLTISTVWRCIAFVSGSIAQLPWDVYRKKSNGKGSDAQPDNPVYWLLSHRANDEMSATVWRELALVYVLIYGNFYAEIEWDRAGRPINLWPIHPKRVRAARDDNGQLYYKVLNVGGEIPIEAKDMFHVPGMSCDGISGLPVIEYAARTMGMSIATEEYGSSFFANSGVPSGVMQHPKNLSKGAQKRLEDHMKKGAGVGRHSQDTLILEEGMEYKILGLQPEQAQFLDTRKFSVEEVCRWFGVPPSKVGHFEKINYNSAEQLSLDVISECLMSWIVKFEQEANFKLLSNNWNGLFCKIDLRGLMRTTHEVRAKYYKDLSSIGVFSVNDVRLLEDLNPIKNGDMHMVPLNMASVDDIASGKLAPGSKNTTTTSTTTGDGTSPNPADTQVQDPNAPQPPKVSVDEERRRTRLLQLLDETLDDIDASRSARKSSGEAGNAQRLIN